MRLFDLLIPDPGRLPRDQFIINWVEKGYLYLQKAFGIPKWKILWIVITIQVLGSIFHEIGRMKIDPIGSILATVIILASGLFWVIALVFKEQSYQKLADEKNQPVENVTSTIPLFFYIRMLVLCFNIPLFAGNITTFFLKGGYVDVSDISLPIILYLLATDTYPNNGPTIKDRLKSLKDLFSRRSTVVQTPA